MYVQQTFCKYIVNIPSGTVDIVHMEVRTVPLTNSKDKHASKNEELDTTPLILGEEGNKKTMLLNLQTIGQR